MVTLLPEASRSDGPPVFRRAVPCLMAERSAAVGEGEGTVIEAAEEEEEGVETRGAVTKYE